MTRLTHKLGAILLLLCTLPGCRKNQPTGKASSRSWPKDNYQPKARPIPDEVLAQEVIGITATDEIDTRKHKTEPAIAGLDVVTLRDSSGHIHVQLNAFHRRLPFILRLPGRHKNWRLNMGREGRVIVFQDRHAHALGWAAIAVPKAARVKDIKLYVDGRLDRPVAFPGRSDEWRRLRWPKKGALQRFPAFFVIALQTETGLTLLRTFGVDKLGRQTTERNHLVKCEKVTPTNLKAIITAAAKQTALPGFPSVR